MEVEGQTIVLRKAESASSFRVKALSGTMETAAGDWSVMLLGDFLTMSIGYGAYAATWPTRKVLSR